MTKVLNEKIDEGTLRWFGHVERMEEDKIAKRVYVLLLTQRVGHGRGGLIL